MASSVCASAIRSAIRCEPVRTGDQTAWRLRAAWGKKDPKAAEKDLRQTARWLEGFAPRAASSLLEGLEETLTVQKLQLAPHLCRILSSTNLIENCFSQAAHRTRRV